MNTHHPHRPMAILFLATIGALCPLAAHADDACAVGARVIVEPLDVPATVVGRSAVSCRVHYADGRPDEWVHDWQVKPSANGAATVGGAASGTADAGLPRPGKYVCLGYAGGSGAPTFRWYLTLAGDRYRQTVPDLEPGTFAFDAANRTLDFTSGPYARNGWMGLFSVEREGRTHRVVLRDRAKQAQGPRVGEYGNFHCTNSTDAPH